MSITLHLYESMIEETISSKYRP